MLNICVQYHVVKDIKKNIVTSHINLTKELSLPTSTKHVRLDRRNISNDI